MKNLYFAFVLCLFISNIVFAQSINLRIQVTTCEDNPNCKPLPPGGREIFSSYLNSLPHKVYPNKEELSILRRAFAKTKENINEYCSLKNQNKTIINERCNNLIIAATSFSNKLSITSEGSLIKADFEMLLHKFSQLKSSLITSDARLDPLFELINEDLFYFYNSMFSTRRDTFPWPSDVQIMYSHLVVLYDQLYAYKFELEYCKRHRNGGCVVPPLSEQNPDYRLLLSVIKGLRFELRSKAKVIQPPLFYGDKQILINFLDPLIHNLNQVDELLRDMLMNRRGDAKERCHDHNNITRIKNIFKRKSRKYPIIDCEDAHLDGRYKTFRSSLKSLIEYRDMIYLLN